METRIENVADKKLEELAKDPQNLVYRYVDRKPLDEVVPITTVRQNVADLWKEVQDLKVASAPKRRQIVCENKRWLKFSETHPDIFDRIVHPKSEQHHIDLLFKMVDIFDRQQKGKIKDGRALLGQYIYDKFGMSPEEYRKENPDHTVHQLPTQN